METSATKRMKRCSGCMTSPFCPLKQELTHCRVMARNRQHMCVTWPEGRMCESCASDASNKKQGKISLSGTRVQSRRLSHTYIASFVSRAKFGMVIESPMFATSSPFFELLRLNLHPCSSLDMSAGHYSRGMRDVGHYVEKGEDSSPESSSDVGSSASVRSEEHQRIHSRSRANSQSRSSRRHPSPERVQSRRCNRSYSRSPSPKHRHSYASQGSSSKGTLPTPDMSLLDQLIDSKIEQKLAQRGDGDGGVRDQPTADKPKQTPSKRKAKVSLQVTRSRNTSLHLR